MTGSTALDVAAVVAALVVAFAAPRWLRHRAAHMACAAHHSAAMGDAAAALIANPDVPDEMAHFLRAIVQDAQRPAVARSIVRGIIAGRPKQPDKTGLHAEFERLGLRDQDLFAAVVGNAVLASAHSSLILAPPMQHILQWGLAQENPARFDTPEKAWRVADGLQHLRTAHAMATA